MKQKKITLKNKFFAKSTQSTGISLIALVITIIVILILSATVVMSLNNNNILTNSSNARYATDLDTMQSYLELAIQKISLKYQCNIELDTGEVNIDNNSNVKETKGIIKWQSTDIPNLVGEIVFDEGLDQDITFYTGYKLPIYGSQTQWYVDKLGKLVLKTGSRIYGADKIPTQTVNAMKVLNNPQKYYGMYVNYTVDNALTQNYKWRILYATNDNIFLISDDYISLDDLPSTKSNKKPVNMMSEHTKAATFNNIVSDYTGSKDIADDLKWFNSNYFKNSFSDINCNNMKAIAYLLDKEIWTKKFKGNGAKYVVGAPSVEILLNSYNNYIGSPSLYQVRIMEYEGNFGYMISCDGGKTFNLHSEKYLDYDNQTNNLYWIDDNHGADAYWICSPSAHTSSRIMHVISTGGVYTPDLTNPTVGFRPLICLNSNVVLNYENNELNIE